MPVLLLLLLLGVVAYFIWRARTTTLTRDCRWRRVSAQGAWRCAYCGATCESAQTPVDCLKPPV
jgi:hypothetical protein